MRIGQIAKASGVNIETIRYYERESLLSKPKRTSSGYREFSPDTVHGVRFIKRAQGLGFTLKEIRELINLHARPDADCNEVRSVATAKIKDINRKLESLTAMKKALEQVVRSCPGRGPIANCSIIDSIQESKNGRR